MSRLIVYTQRCLIAEVMLLGDPMERYVVLLIDPRVNKRDSFVQALSLRFDVRVVPLNENPIEAYVKLKPHAVIATMRQVNLHGFQLCKDLRSQAGEARCLMVVHGAADRQVKDTSRPTVTNTWKVDHYQAAELEPSALEALLWHELTRRFPRERVPSQVTQEVLASPELKPLKLDKDTKGALGKGFHLIPLKREISHIPPEERTFMELLNSPPTLRNLQALIRRRSPGRPEGEVTPPAKVSTEVPRGGGNPAK